MGWAINDAFCNSLGIWTYDSEISYELVKRFVPCIDAIITGTTHAFIKIDKQRYIDFVLVATYLDKQRMGSWGTSIRGCFFSTDPHPNGQRPVMSVTWDGCPIMHTTQDIRDYFVTLCAMVKHYTLNNPHFEESKDNEKA